MNNHKALSKSSSCLLLSQQKYQQPHFTFQSQKDSSVISLTCDKIKSKIGDAFSESSSKSQNREQLKAQIVSIIKGFQMKISNEKQTFQLLKLKYQEQLKHLRDENKKLLGLKITQPLKDSSMHCSLCSNGEVIIHMKNMLESIQKDHRGCIMTKSTLVAKVMQLQQRILVLQEDWKQSEGRSKKLKNEYKLLKEEINQSQRDKRERQRLFRQLQRAAQVKEMQLDQEIKKYQDIQKDYHRLKLEFQAKISHLNYQSFKSSKISDAQHKHEILEGKNLNQNLNSHQNFQNMAFDHQQAYKNKPDEIKVTFDQNGSNFAANQKVIVQQSYSQYSTSKRLNRKPDFFPLQQTMFDTFRPTKRVGQSSSCLGYRFSYL